MNISIIEPQILVAQGLKSLLIGEKNIQNVNIYTNIQNFLENNSENVPDIVFVDLRIPELNLQKLIDYSLIKLNPKLKIMSFAEVENISKIRQAIKIGVKGVLTKSSTNADELFNAILEVQNGNRYFCESLRNKLIDIYFLNDLNIDNFTPSELDIIQALCNGITVKKIAEKQNKNIHTMQYYIRKILAKADVNRIPDLILYAIKHGLVNPQILIEA